MDLAKIKTFFVLARKCTTNCQNKNAPPFPFLTPILLKITVDFTERSCQQCY